MELGMQCVGELAGLAEKLMEKVPEGEEWTDTRRFLKDTVNLLRRGDKRSGVQAFKRLLPFIGKALYNVDRYVKANDTFNVTESITDHFLVDDESREEVEKCMRGTKHRLVALRERIDVFGHDLDLILEEVIQDDEDVSFVTAMKLAFRMNRMSASIYICEDRLRRTRHMLDDLDTHVAGKNFLATILSYVCFLGSVAFSATGNLPAGAAFLATATATRKSAQGLQEYRQKLAQIDRDHNDLQAEMTEWRHHFTAEQRNFLLLAGLKYCLLMFIGIAILVALLGKAANFLFFSAIVIYLGMKVQETNQTHYVVGLAVATLAVGLELTKYRGLEAYNCGAALFILYQFLGFLQVI